MTENLKKITGLLTDSPGKIWLYGIFPFFGLVAVLCLVSVNFSVFTPDQTGYRLFREQNFKAAGDRFQDPEWEAAAFYRNGNFKSAAAIYGGLDSPEGAFNHGNSLVMLGKYEEAVKRYTRALELRPDWQAAEKNLNIAALRAERVKKEGGDMTGGKMKPDEIVFSDNKSSSNDQDEDVQAPIELSSEEMRAVWLRNVQTEPADFLRAKFAYQQAMKSRTENAEKPGY